MARKSRDDEEDDDPGYEVVNDTPPRNKSVPRRQANDFEVVEDEPKRQKKKPRVIVEDYEERPTKRKKSKKRKTDDEGRLGPLGGMFRYTNVVFLLLFGLFCRGIALLLSLICLATTEDEQAKSNATLVLVVDVIVIIILLAIRFLA